MVHDRCAGDKRRKMPVYILFIYVFLSGLAASRPGDGAQAGSVDCISQSRNQIELNECVGRESQAADERLNLVYQRLMSALDDPQKEKLKIAERHWIAHRDAVRKLGGISFSGGKGQWSVMEWNKVLATRARIVELEEIETRGLRRKIDSCPGKSSTELTSCLEKLFEKADGDLNKIYRKCLRKVSCENTSCEVRDLQRAWIPFRDANADFYAEHFAGEGISLSADDVKILVKLRMTNEQKKFLIDNMNFDGGLQ